ncbi:MAG: YraN family protein [Candidatus Omnitrophica bacterium]|nr:YraN family protein [Candidatus Omnitrophota bacterium]
MTENTTQRGKQAEDAAVVYLQAKGYRILTRNYRNPFGEIDIIARDGPTLCFVEVRSRAETWHGHPFESISPLKRRKLTRAAQGFLAGQNDDDVDARFDVVAVIPDDHGGYSLELIQNAFEVE